MSADPGPLSLAAAQAAMTADLLGNVADDVARWFADEWVSLDQHGWTTKAQLVDAIRDGRLAHHTFTAVGPPVVRDLGDVVVVTVRVRSSGTWTGSPYRVEEWITDVFRLRDGRWSCVFTQKTPVATG